MTASTLARRVRGLVGNALVWGAAWSIGAFAVFALLRLAGGTPFRVMPLVRSAAQFGVMGAIAGTAFSTFIALRYRGRRLADISWLRFTIGGGIVTGLFVPGFIMLMRALSGDAPLAAGALARNGVVGLAFGAAAAGLSLGIAQLADRHGRRDESEDIGLIEGGDALRAGADAPRKESVRRPT
ncbi:MAG TPA: hypothetical protein VE967_00330 [Gemmatimonadaceae bacterium]|nr:hypothetical protein [Gemmatimonadaceae bacterium]